MKEFMTKVKTGVAKANTKFAMRMAGVKSEDGDHMIEILGTIIIAIVILMFFKDKIVAIFQNATNKTGNEVNNLFNAV